jgi:ParB/RepB/Spo0J family partition protein
MTLDQTTSPTHTEGFQYIDPKEIKVKEGLDRFRKDLGKINDLVESLNKYGQLQPVVVNRDYELIAGGRRLAACLLAERQVGIVFKDTIDPLLMRELEVEENVQRKAFTPAEEVLAVDELHRLKQAIYGETCQGIKGGWTVAKTADIVGKSSASVIEDIRLAEAIKLFPELSTAKTKSDIKKAVAALEKVATRADNLTKYEETISKTSLPISYKNQDALSFMPTLEDESIDLLLTDPPYGMDIFSNIEHNTGFEYNDEAEKALILYKHLAEQSIRFCKKSAHAYIFTCPEHFYTVRQMFISAGWDCFIRPMLWIKRTAGTALCNAPLHWPASSYETFLYARRIDSRILRPGQLDWIECDRVSSVDKVHQAQKPIKLLRELISRVAYPNTRLADPFAGSASSLIAGLEEKLIVTGSELSKEAYASGQENISNWLQERSKNTTLL